MRKTMMNRLFYGEISPWDRDRAATPAYVKLHKKIDEEREHFKSAMSQDESRRFNALEDLYVKEASFEQEDCFAYGLRFGILLMMEVLAADTARP